MALHIRGNGRCEARRSGRMNDLWDAVHRAEASANGVDIAQSYSYLSEWVGLQEGPLRSLEMNRAQIEACEVRGMAGQAMWSTAESLWMLDDAGRWDEALERAARAIDWATQQEDSQVGTVGLTYSARILAHRGQLDEAASLVERYLHRPGRSATSRSCRRRSSPPRSSPGRAATRRARSSCLREFDGATRDGPTEYRELQLPEAVRICRLHGDVELAETLAGSRPVFVVRTTHAMSSVRALLAEMRGDHERAAAMFEEAADGWHAWGDPFERAHAFGRGRAVRVGPRSDVRRERARDTAGAIFAELGVPVAPGYREERSCCSPMSSPRQRPSRPRVRDWRRSTPSRSARAAPRPTNPDRGELPVGRAPPAADRRGLGVAARLPPPAAEATLSVTEVDRAFADAADASGPGSVG